MHALRLAPILLAALLPVVPGCQSARDRDRDPSPLVPMPVLMSTGGQDAQIERTGVFLAHRPLDLLPLGQDVVEDLSIDFDTQTAVVVTLGQRPTAGHWVRIRSAQLEGDRLYVQFTINEPGEDQMVAQVITHPWAVATIPRVGPQVRIHAEPEEVTGAALPDDIFPGDDLP